jgi:hypothetical protein
MSSPNRDWASYNFYTALRLRKRWQPVDDHYFWYKEIAKHLEDNNLTISKYRGSDCIWYYGIDVAYYGYCGYFGRL